MLNLTHVKMPANTGPMSSSTATGLVYSGGGIIDSVNHGSSCIDAAMDARGSVQFTGGACTDNAISALKSVTLSDATVGSDVNVWTGNLVMSDSKVLGNASVDGKYPNGTTVLCPSPVSGNAMCTGLAAGPSTVGLITGKTVGNSTVNAAGTITVGSTSHTVSVCPGPVKTTGGNEITGCIYPNNSSFSVYSPKVVPLPTVVIPTPSSPKLGQKIAFNKWTSALYTWKTTSTCGGTTPTSLVGEINSVPRPPKTTTVIVANCAVNLPVGSATAATVSHNVAIFAPDGITLGGGFKFNMGSTTSSVHLSLIVPTPGTPGCQPADNITFGAGSATDFPAPVTKRGSTGKWTPSFEMFISTPCKFTVDSNVTLKGTVAVGTLTITSGHTLTIRHGIYIPPDFTYGSQPLAVSRYIVGG